MKKILALVLAAVMMLSVVAFAEPSITIDDTVTVDNAAIEVVVDEEGIAAVVAAYAGEGEVTDAIAVIAMQSEAATVTFTLKAALTGNVVAVAVAGEYTEELAATVNADGSVTVEFTAEAMTALTNGGYVLFVTK